MVNISTSDLILDQFSEDDNNNINSSSSNNNDVGIRSHADIRYHCNNIATNTDPVIITLPNK